MSELGDIPGAAGRFARTRASIAAGPLLQPVLSRIFGVHGARADLPVDRLEDALLIADALAARSGPGRMALTIQSEPGRLEIRVGPLEPGGGQRLLDGATLPQTGPVVERLADEVRVRRGAAGGETLVVRVGS